MKAEQLLTTLLLLLWVQATPMVPPAQATLSSPLAPQDTWWDDGWPYRFQVEVAASRTGNDTADGLGYPLGGSGECW